MPLIHSPTYKAKSERFFNKLERFIDDHDGRFGKPTRIYTDGSTEFISTRYLIAFLDQLEKAEARAKHHSDEGSDAS
ncbi:hypothetical protein ACFPFP_02330 [Bradyrhizobium sp. GCM10023182]|uniref:Integrase catalytic domain-containing protein n=1 Tax=Bradyrhizobium zhengyangense TaxID=2911009 RepID=A0ABS9LFI4_9BRAD|nr:hypothetical protein [Bradyrhizobium zhengyangense]MCG2665766.1 hypothetical protein [Bradyrhizobium zhengyangense]